jgi:hypothetical protein
MANSDIDVASAVLAHLAHQIQKSTKQDVSLEDLRTFLVACPWVLVLDGLDEVPVSAGRDRVLEAISAFRKALSDSGARGILIATTRPQGYADDCVP